MQRKTVVLVCMVDSIHVARWVAQFDPKEVKFILFPSGPNRRVHPKIVEMIDRGKQFDNHMTLVPFGGKLSLPLWALDRFFSDRIRGLLLRRILKKIQPDFVHALEFQHAGYVTIRALEDKSIKTPFIATNYGSDIYWFQRFPKHKAKIQKILERADRYSAECRRDYLLAEELGFQGVHLPLVTNSGLSPKRMSDLVDADETERKLILIKGYHGWAGRAIDILRALKRHSYLIGGYEIRVFSADVRVRIHVWLSFLGAGSKPTCFSKHALDQDQMASLYAQSYIFIASSISDGISTSALEAALNGCLPLQSNTSCITELVPSVFEGQYFDPNEKTELDFAIRYALEKRADLEPAIQSLKELARKRLTASNGPERVAHFYF